MNTLRNILVSVSSVSLFAALSVACANVPNGGARLVAPEQESTTTSAELDLSNQAAQLPAPARPEAPKPQPDFGVRQAAAAR